MAITGLRELARREGEGNRHWERVYRRSFIVTTNDPNDGPLFVLSSLGFYFGDVYASPNGELDRLSFLQSYRYREVGDDGMQWEIDLEWGPYDPLQWPEDPLLHPPDVSIDTQVFEEIVDFDANGTAVLNTAGDPFDPPVIRDVSRSVLVVERNEASYSESLASQYRDTVNSDGFLGADPGTIKCNAIKPTRTWDKLNGFIWRVRYEFAQNRDGWHKKILNAGMRQISSSNYSYQFSNGDPITAPVPLDASGGALGPNQGAYLLEFQIYPEVSFSVFNMESIGEVFG